LSDGAAAGGVLDIEPELSDGAAAGGAAGWLLCAGAGGAAAGSVPEESFFAHAVSSSAAAASALRATFVFIDRYPDALLREPVRRKLSERPFLSFRESFTDRDARVYRVNGRLETA
jgi:hypothetical protein